MTFQPKVDKQCFLFIIEPCVLLNACVVVVDISNVLQNHLLLMSDKLTSPPFEVEQDVSSGKTMQRERERKGDKCEKQSTSIRQTKKVY